MGGGEARREHRGARAAVQAGRGRHQGRRDLEAPGRRSGGERALHPVGDPRPGGRRRHGHTALYPEGACRQQRVVRSADGGQRSGGGGRRCDRSGHAALSGMPGRVQAVQERLSRRLRHHALPPDLRAANHPAQRNGGQARARHRRFGQSHPGVEKRAGQHPAQRRGGGDAARCARLRARALRVAEILRLYRRGQEHHRDAAGLPARPGDVRDEPRFVELALGGGEKDAAEAHAGGNCARHHHRLHGRGR